MSTIMLPSGVTLVEIDICEIYHPHDKVRLLTFPDIVNELPPGKCAVYADREVGRWIKIQSPDQWDIATFDKYPTWGTHCNSRYIITEELFTILALRWL